MKSLFIALAVAGTAVLFAVGPASAASNSNAWQRLNPDIANPSPEHERLTCAQGAGDLLCQYDKVRGSGYHWDRTVARFKGMDVTGSWTCPDWFPAEVCDNVARVWSGHARYWPADGSSFRVAQEMIVVDWAGQKVMFQYWIDQFACPWYRSFSEATTANPGLAFDCLEQ